MSETWKTVTGYEGYYEVSNNGRVRSLDRTVMRGDGIQSRIAGRILKLTKQRGCCARVFMSKESVVATHAVIDLVLKEFGHVSRGVAQRICNQPRFDSIEPGQMRTRAHRPKATQPVIAPSLLGRVMTYLGGKINSLLRIRVWSRA